MNLELKKKSFSQPLVLLGRDEAKKRLQAYAQPKTGGIQFGLNKVKMVVL